MASPDHRVHGWMQTYTGREYNFDKLRPDDICIEDIAHSLSNICRFNGHCRTFYSVASHSMMVSDICQPENKLWGLLHDAGEAFIGDMLWGLKHGFPEIGKAFMALEEQILMVVAEKYRLPWPIPNDVREADRIALAIETRMLFLGGNIADLCRHPGADQVRPLMCVSPGEAKDVFIGRFLGLMEELNGD